MTALRARTFPLYGASIFSTSGSSGMLPSTTIWALRTPAFKGAPGFAGLGVASHGWIAVDCAGDWAFAGAMNAARARASNSIRVRMLGQRRIDLREELA